MSAEQCCFARLKIEDVNHSFIEQGRVGPHARWNNPAGVSLARQITGVTQAGNRQPVSIVGYRHGIETAIVPGTGWNAQSRSRIVFESPFLIEIPDLNQFVPTGGIEVPTIWTEGERVDVTAGTTRFKT